MHTIATPLVRPVIPPPLTPMLKPILYLLAGLVLAIVLGLGYNLAHAGRERLTAGVTAYGWLASPAAAGHPENRAKILEDLIAAELARRSPK